MKLISVNPYNKEKLQEKEEDSVLIVDEKLNRSLESYQYFKLKSIEDRIDILKNFSIELILRKEELATVITKETGKMINEARAEIEKCAWACTYYAQNGKLFLQNSMLQIGHRQAEIRLKPLGPILAIMPWNFPFWQVFRVLAPAILSGNVIVLKHASNVSMCAAALEKLAKATCFEVEVLNVVYVNSSRIEELISHHAIKAITLTGSEHAGKSVAAIAAKYLKKTVLELGGSDPFIIAEHCHLEKALKAAFDARMINMGQSCIAAKRFFVHEFHRLAFIHFITQQIDRLHCGDPLDENTSLAPLSSLSAVKEYQQQIDNALKEGGKVVYKKPILECNSGFAAPILIEVENQNNTVMREETFGPCFAVMFYKKFEDAISMANECRFGLGATLFSDNLNEQHYFKDHIEAGMVFINDFTKSKPYLPFGGIKNSGYGRELHVFGMLEWMNIQAVEVN
jgi:succinate-semialdehyde dehydrogenase/glutarate-semialdehyde dehydrogenase